MHFPGFVSEKAKHQRVDSVLILPPGPQGGERAENTGEKPPVVTTGGTQCQTMITKFRA